MERADLEKRVFQFVMGPQISIVLNSVIGLRIPQLLTSPKTSVELAEITSTIPAKLERTLLTLEAFGFFHLNADTNQWSNSQMSELFADEAYSDMWYYPNSPFVYELLSSFPEALKVDKSAAEIHYNKNVFEALKERPVDLVAFQKGLRATTKRISEPLCKLIDLSNVNRVLDIGGGDGTLVLELVKANPHISAAVFEREEVRAIATNTFSQYQLGDRTNFIAGNFLESIPEGFDCLIMKHTIQCLDDDNCKILLDNCRRSLHSGNKLKIIEHMIVKNDPAYPVIRALDMVMLAHGNSKQRTREEFEALLSNSGFRLDNAIKVALDFVIEATAI